MSDFLQLAGRTVLVTGIANRRSVAWHIARTLEEQGARVVYSVRSAARRQSLAALLGDRTAFVCDVEEEERRPGSRRNCRPPALVRCTAWSTRSRSPTTARA